MVRSILKFDIPEKNEQNAKEYTKSDLKWNNKRK